MIKFLLFDNFLTSEVSMAAAATSLFPALPAFTPDQRYSAIMKSAESEYANYEPLFKQAESLDSTLRDWQTKYANITEYAKTKSKEDLETELNGVADQYNSLRNIREECLRILAIYDRAIAQCQPPTLDTDTLTVMARLGINLGILKDRYNAVFQEDLERLKVQRKAIQELYNRMVSTLPQLKQSFDPLARHCSSTTLFSSPLRLIGRAPYADAIATARRGEKKSN